MIFIIILFLGFCIIDYFESLNKPTKADIMKQRRIRKEAREKRAYIERLYLERIALGI